MSSWKAALRGRTVCVVGGCGAVGSAVVAQLDESNVIVADRTAPDPTDVLDVAQLERVIKGASIVIHVAGLKHAGRSADEALTYFNVNATGTANVAEACRRSGVEALVYASTAHVYGVPREVPVEETHPTLPLSVYGASKLAGEAAIIGFSASFGIRAAIARMANVYGHALDRETVIGLAVCQARAGDPIELRNLESVRDFLHIDDAGEALVRLAAYALGADGCVVVNVSDGRGVRTREIAELAARLATPHVRIIDPGHVVERVPELVLSTARLQSVLDWIPSRDFAANLSRMVTT